MIDPAKENLHRLHDLNFYRPISYQSKMRFVLKGMRSADGLRFEKLEAVKVGGYWMSSQEAVHRLIAAVNTPSNPPPAQMTPDARAAENERAKRVLERAGV